MTFHAFTRRARALPALSQLVAFGALAALVPLLSGCGSGGRTIAASTPAPDGPATVTSRYLNLVYTLTVPKRIYARGEAVPLTFTVQNVGTTDVSFQDAAPDYVGGEVRRSADDSIVDVFTEMTVPRAAETKGATRLTVIYTHDLPAGQTKSFTLYWDQTDTYTDLGSAMQAAAGVYNVRAALYTNNLNINGTVVQSLESDQLGPAPIAITVQ